MPDPSLPKKPEIIPKGEVECDEVYAVAGHKGQSDAVKKKPKESAKPIKRRMRAGTLEKEKPPILGMIERGGQGLIQMLKNVQQVTIKPLIQSTIATGVLIYSGE